MVSAPMYRCTPSPHKHDAHNLLQAMYPALPCAVFILNGFRTTAVDALQQRRTAATAT